MLNSLFAAALGDTMGVNLPANAPKIGLLILP